MEEKSQKMMMEQNDLDIKAHAIMDEALAEADAREAAKQWALLQEDEMEQDYFQRYGYGAQQPSYVTT